MTLSQDLSSRFQVLGDIGSGPTGKSLHAQDSQTGRTGVLKVIETGAGVPAAERQRIKRELAKQTKIANPRLATLFECGSAEPLWLFREYVEGETLAQRLGRGPLSLTAALAITAQIATALDELHRAGLLHRDLKPAHVIVRPVSDGNENVSVIDAGIAARIETGTVFDVIGTAAYVSPEQVLGKLVSFRSDLYALGCILFEMLSGKPPFEGPDAKAILEAHKSTAAPALSVSVPAEVNTLLGSLLAKEPRSRPFSAQQVRRALEPFLPSSSGPRRSSLPPPPPGQPMRTAQGMPAPIQTKAASQPTDDDIEELSADEMEAIEPTVVTSAPSAMSTGELDPMDLEEAEDSVATANPLNAAADAPSTTATPATTTAQMSPVELESVVQSSLTDDVPALDNSDAEADATPASAQRGARAAVNFDVESLFDEDTAQPTGETDVTRVFRPIPEDAAAALLQGANATTPAATLPDADVDPDRTVVVANPYGKQTLDNRVLMAVAAVAVILLLITWTVLSGDDAPEPLAAAGQAAAEPSDDTRAAGAPSDNAGKPTAANTPAAAAEPERSATPEPTPTEPTPSEPTSEVAPAAGPAVVEATDTEAEAEDNERAEENANDDGPAPTARAGRAERRASTPRPQTARPAAAGQSADELRALARAEFQARRYREAARYYQQAGQKAPSDAGTFAGLGASLLAAGDAKTAIPAYQRAIQLSPKQSGFHAALGRAYFQLGDRARAIASYKKAIELDPNNGVARAALTRLES